MYETLAKANGFFTDVQVMSAVIFGMFVQFFLGSPKNLKIAITVVLSSLFLALFIMPAVIETVGLNPDSKLAISLYALSAVMSIELLAILLKVLPAAISTKAKQYLGVEDGSQN